MLVASAEGGTGVAWNVNNQDLRGLFYSIQGGREVLLSNQLIAAYRVNGTPKGSGAVPQPAGLLSLGLGVVGLGGMAWLRRIRRPARECF